MPARRSFLLEVAAMSNTALYALSKSLIDELYELLQMLDPSRWKVDLELVTRERLRRLSLKVREMVSSLEGLEDHERHGTQPLLERLQDLERFFTTQAPVADLPPGKV